MTVIEKNGHSGQIRSLFTPINFGEGNLVGGLTGITVDVNVSGSGYATSVKKPKQFLIKHFAVIRYHHELRSDSL